MRRKDREVTDFNKIMSIIDECDIIRIGLSDGDFPYIVPLNFAYTLDGDKLCFYVHGAMAGRKYELMQQNKLCSFEMDVPIKMACMYDKKDVTMLYKSVMGTASVEFLADDEKEAALDDIIMNRYDETRHFEYDKRAIARVAIAKISVISLSAKANE